MKMPQWRRPAPAKPGEVNYGFVDRFTLVHFGIGVFYGLLELPIAWVAILAVGWELIEDWLKAYIPRIFPHATADTWKNYLGDVLAVFTGWALLVR